MWDGVDRRRFVRGEYPCLITLRKYTSPPLAILTHTEDISVGGLRVIIGKNLGPMTEVDLELDLMDTLPTVLSRATISWVKEVSYRQKGKPQYDTGIQFLGLKDEYRRRVQNIVDHLSRTEKKGRW